MRTGRKTCWLFLGEIEGCGIAMYEKVVHDLYSRNPHRHTGTASTSCYFEGECQAQEDRSVTR